MASAMYRLGVSHIMGTATQVNLLTDTIKVALVTTTYTFAQAHEFYSSVSANAVGTPATLGTKTLNTPTDGTFDAADGAPMFTAVAGGSTIGSLVVYKDTGVAATSPVIAFIDVTDLATNGGDINVTWDAGADRIFRLAA